MHLAKYQFSNKLLDMIYVNIKRRKKFKVKKKVKKQQVWETWMWCDFEQKSVSVLFFFFFLRAALVAYRGF